MFVKLDLSYESKNKKSRVSFDTKISSKLCFLGIYFPELFSFGIPSPEEESTVDYIIIC
jgi:hypothetical protein